MAAIELAKPHVDIGLSTDRYDELRAFYVERLGLPYEELLKIGGGVHQHRLALAGAVLKVNSSREPLADAPTNFVGLEIDAADAAHLVDPDGTDVRLVPGSATRIRWASSDVDRLSSLLAATFGDASAIGRTAISVEPGGGPVGAMRSRGFRYVTVQVHDVRAAHASCLAAGWAELRPPVRLGDTAAISFVADPDGAPVEISQRASLTGPLPEL